MLIRVDFLTFVRAALLAAIVVLFASAATAQDAASRGPSESYLIQPGDLLEISVWREEYLEREVAVQPDGKISFPLAGVVQAAGGTVDEVQVKVSQRLAQFFAFESASLVK